MPSLKSSIAVAVCSLLLGLWLGSKIERPQAQIKQEQAAKCRAVAFKQTKADGSVVEGVEFESEAKQVQEIKAQSKPKFGVGVFHDKSIFAEYRVGQSPAFLVGEYNQTGQIKIGVKLEF